MTPQLPGTLQFETLPADAGIRIDLHRSLFFKIVYICHGAGTRHLQQTSISYNEGDLFVAVPGEKIHYLETGVPTQLIIVKFSSLFINRERLLYLLQYANHTPDYMVLLRAKRDLIRQLFENISAEIYDHPNAGSEYLQQLISTLVFLIGEKIKASINKPIHHDHDQRLADMLHYIHLNIFEPEKLSIKRLSQQFAISPVYIGRYFKSNTGQNLHQYILSYKLKLIENRLINSNMRISEIADEFGFNDKSYLNKFFLKFRGVSPLAYRKNNRQSAGTFTETLNFVN
jgi:AraC-like DNA-binding protein